MRGWKTDWWLSGTREEVEGRVGREGNVVIKGQQERLMWLNYFEYWIYQYQYPGGDILQLILPYWIK